MPNSIVRSAGLRAGCRCGGPGRTIPASARAWTPPRQPVSHPSKPKTGLPGTPVWRPRYKFLFPGLSRLQRGLAFLPVAGAKLVGLQGVEYAQYFLGIAAH